MFNTTFSVIWKNHITWCLRRGGATCGSSNHVTFLNAHAMLCGYQFTMMGCGQHWQSKKRVNCNNFLQPLGNFRYKTPLRKQNIPEEFYEYIQYICLFTILMFYNIFGYAFNGFRTDRRGNRRICMNNVILLTVLCGASMTQHCADHQNISEHPTMCNKYCFGDLRCGGS